MPLNTGSSVESGKNLPKEILPCPIADASFEIRFSTKINANAVFGLIYNSLQPEFSNVENLPILQLPEPVRSSDPNFKFKPHYKLISEKIVVQVGPDVLTISSFPEYVGWQDFSEAIFTILQKIEGIGIIQEVSRMGIRYINFFQDDIFNLINVKLSLSDQDIGYNNTVIRTEITQEDFRSTLQIANNAFSNGEHGSIIDIDTFLNTESTDFLRNNKDLINGAHQKEKELFFSLLKKEFLETLKPVY